MIAAISLASLPGTAGALSLNPVASAGQRSATLQVTPTETTPVEVTGRVKLPRAEVKLKIFSEGSRLVRAGEVAYFKLHFPKRLRRALSSLSPQKSLKLWITATFTEADGRLVTPVVRLELPGRAR